MSTSAVYPSSQWAERAFCKRCGTHLYYKLLATGEYFVPAGAFDSGDFELASQIYIDKKPSYYRLPTRLPLLTEQQVIAQYAIQGARLRPDPDSELLVVGGGDETGWAFDLFDPTSYLVAGRKPT